ncbi:hypothetical protein Clacol_007845 [Clathrus columnatus]|uniref:Major facilitator superfamily (MFS) profile domain-containing protein n=1 Tax=Clathrus columnatus TaxID=1419009 RepID=A0AAV5AG24_9AGAM|nr:hypothetical protein Clacol_007845 [Clathrus columnatus]
MITNPNDPRSPDHEDSMTASTLRSMPASTPEKPSPTPLPKMQLFILLYIQLAEPITAHIILPFIVQLIQDTGVTNGDITRVGYYTGLVESLFFLTETLTILQWGRISDKIGRKPVLLIGLFGLTLSMLSFGLSRTFFTVVASRALAGALNGNTGVIKCMMGEITDETNVAQGFSFLPLMWAIGNIFGPLLGGLLQHPYDRLGGLFHRSQFWKNYPYFLPCVTASIFSFSGLIIGGCLLKEVGYNISSRGWACIDFFVDTISTAP